MNGGRVALIATIMLAAACSSEQPTEPAQSTTTEATEAFQSSPTARTVEREVAEVPHFQPRARFDRVEGGYGATILALGFDAHIRDDASLTIGARNNLTIDGSPAERWSYQLGAPTLSRNQLRLEPVSEPSLSTTDSSVIATVRDGVELEYVHQANGLEQLVRIEERIAGEGPLRIEFPSTGTARHVASDEHTDTVTVGFDGVPRFTWSKLRVFDDTGTQLAAHMRGELNRFVIEVDDAHATYPILVDPLAAAPNMYLRGDFQLSAPTTGAHGQFGQSISVSGDLDGDNIDDLLVGQPLFSNGQPNEGRFVVYRGLPGGFSNLASLSFETNIAGVNLGASVAFAGDVDDDGYDDILVGLPGYSLQGIDRGRVALFRGSAASPFVQLPAAASIDGRFDDEQLGHIIHGVGDLNCDGFDDIALGSPMVDEGRGDVSIYYGRPYAPPFLPGLDIANPLRLTGPAPDARLGSSLAGRVNFDNDFYVWTGAECDDLAVSVPGLEQVWVYFGAGAGLQTSSPVVLSGDQAGSEFGYAIAGVQSTDGNGFDELLVSAPGYDVARNGNTLLDAGKLWLFEGALYSAGRIDAAPAWTYEGERARANFGAALAGGGDFNADGRGDFAASAPTYSEGEQSEGALYAFLGVPGQVAPQLVWSYQSNQEGARIGESLGIGDYTGDGMSDLFAAAPLYDTTNNGKVTTDVGAVLGFGGRANCYIDGAFHDERADHPTNPCAWCIPQVSRVQWAPRLDGISCDDGNACSHIDECVSGQCVGVFWPCEDGDDCTVDSCDPETGACNFDEFEPPGSPCGEPAGCLDETTAFVGGACDNSGVCIKLDSLDCTPYACDEGACKTDCASDDDCADAAYCDTNNTCVSDNRAPVARAGTDQLVAPEATVTLDGSQSTDPDGDALSFLWTQSAGTSVELEDDQAAVTSFVAPDVDDATLSFTLTVTDEQGLSHSDVVDVRVLDDTPNRVPVAVIAGPTQVDVGATIELDGQDSYDPDEDALTFSWSVVVGSQDAVGLSGQTTDTLQIEFLESALSGDTFTFRLIVSDGEQNSEPAEHTVTLAGGDDVGGDTGGDAGPDTGTDAGGPGSDSDDGCGCAAGAASPGTWTAVMLMLFGWTVLRLGRRRRSA